MKPVYWVLFGVVGGLGIGASIMAFGVIYYQTETFQPIPFSLIEVTVGLLVVGVLFSAWALHKASRITSENSKR